MKKKTIIALILTVVLIALAVLLVLGIKGAVKYGFLEGRVLIADNGSYLIILDDHSPIKMSDHSAKGGAFLDLQTGDKIRVLHDGVRESYPGQTGVYHVRLLERGSMEDIPADVVNALRQLGWMDKAE
jgi:hypothetical protein